MLPQKYIGTDPNGNTTAMAKIQIEETQFLPLAQATNPGSYIITFWVLCDTNNNICVHMGSTDTTEEVDTTWKKVSITANLNTGDYVDMELPAGTYYIWHNKFEKGNRATDWTKAPEDGELEVEKLVQRISEVSITLDGVTTRVGVLETDSANTISRLSLAEQKITPEAITSTVLSSTEWGEMSSTVQQTAEGLTTKVAKDGVISAINQTSEKITIDANKINLDGYVTVTNLSTKGETVIDGGNIKANTITANQLTTDNLVSKDENSWINLSKGTFNYGNKLIWDGKDLTIDGYVTLSSIYSEGTTTIDGSKITTGSIGADQIKTSELIVGTNIAMGSNAKISWGNVTDKTNVMEKPSDKTQAQYLTTITEDTLKTTNVTAENLIVNAAKINGQLNANQIASGAITTDKLATNSVTAEKINVKDLFAQDITATNMTISGDSKFGNFRANTEIEGLAYENSNYGGVMYLGKIAALIDEDEYGFQLGNGNSMTNIQPGGVFVQSNCGGSYSRKTTIHGGFIETYCISTSQSGGTVSIGSDIVPLYSDEDTLLDITLGSSSKKFADLYTSKFNGTSVNSDGIASTSGYGVTKLSSSYTSSSTSIAANSNAVYSLFNKMKTIVTRDVATSIFSSCTYDNNRLRCVKIKSVSYSMTMFSGVIEVTNGSTAISYQWVPFFQIPEGFRPSTTIQTVVHVFNKNTSRLSVTYAVEIYTNGNVLINGSFAASESWRFVFPCIMYI